MKKIKMAIFVLIFIIMPLTLNLVVLKGISGIEWVAAIRANTPTAVFIVMDTVSMIALALFVKFIRKQSPISFSNINRITFKNSLLCILIGIVMAMFTNSFLNISYFQVSMSSIIGSIDWLIGGNVIFVIVATLVNSAYKEFCFRGLAFNEMRRTIPVVIALIIQASFYAGELVYFNNPIPAVVYAFIGQLVFGLIFLQGGSFWSSYLSQVSCTLGLVLFRRTIINNIFSQNLSIVLMLMAVLILVTLILQLKKHKRIISTALEG